MTTRQKNLHVVPRDDGWAVREEGTSGDIVQTLTQDEAVEAARRILQQEEGNTLYLHDREGNLQEKRVYISIKRDSVEIEITGDTDFVNETTSKLFNLIEAVDNLDRVKLKTLYNYIEKKRQSEWWVVSKDNISQFDKAMRSVQQEAESMSEDEINALIDDVIHEVRSEQRED